MFQEIESRGQKRVVLALNISDLSINLSMEDAIVLFQDSYRRNVLGTSSTVKSPNRSVKKGAGARVYMLPIRDNS